MTPVQIQNENNGMNPSILPHLVIGKIVGQMEFSNLGGEMSLEENPTALYL